MDRSETWLEMACLRCVYFLIFAEDPVHSVVQADNEDPDWGVARKV